ncbi:hypothetical protein N8I77_001733 [Diaporthe amygdali]|uniref:Cytochrome P450 n=1 Tax=Phomopsis amygdali TaxID=1214568 RepID=A0AAD9STE0_PHOAM|nr:hypothetical protein N8I77_001733 [Diaporthe amygdali]
MFVTLVLMVVRALVRYLIQLKSKRFCSNSLVQRYPHVVPCFGPDLILQIRWDFHRGQLSEGMRRRHAFYGPTFSTQNLFDECIYTIEPENIRTITKNKFDEFEKSEWVSEAAKHIGSGILVNEGEAWRFSRAKLKPIFGKTEAREPALLEPHVRRLIANMEALAESGASFEFHGLVDMLMLDVVTEFLFGESTGCLESPRSPKGKEGVEFLARVRSFDGPSAKFMAIGAPAWVELRCSYPKLNDMVIGMKAFFRRKLAESIAGPKSSEARSSPGSVFKMMEAADISDEQIQSELQNIFFASWDTTSALLANIVYVLLQNHGVQDRLREEIRSLHGESPTKQDLNKMKYLRLVVEEGLRLYSPVTSNSRRAKRDTILPRGGGQDGQGPIIVRAGTTIVWSTYSLNRDPQWYGSDWAEFKPERWASVIRSRAIGCTAATAGQSSASSDSDAGQSQTSSSEDCRDSFFKPFGSGPRACLGQQIARNEVSYIIVRLLQEFPRLRAKEEVEPKPFREAKAVSFYNAYGVWVSVR